jgi:hypothetical protein
MRAHAHLTEEGFAQNISKICQNITSQTRKRIDRAARQAWAKNEYDSVLSKREMIDNQPVTERGFSL